MSFDIWFICKTNLIKSRVQKNNKKKVKDKIKAVLPDEHKLKSNILPLIASQSASPPVLRLQPELSGKKHCMSQPRVC